MLNLSPDAAIRQFCAARVEQQIQEREWELDQELDTWPSLDLHQPASSSEVEELIGTFFNDEKENEASDHLPENPSMIDHNRNTYVPFEDVNVMDQGLQLVNLLLACAEAVGCRDVHLAHSILAQIWPISTPWGDSLQRVSHCFAMGLKSRLSFIQNGNLDPNFVTREEKREGFGLLHQTTPFIAFGFMAANEAICQAATGKEKLHIVDLGTEHIHQWPPLIVKLSSRPEGPPRIIRITSIVASDQNTEIENSMTRLCKEAYHLGIYLEHHLVTEKLSPSTIEKLEQRKDEVVVVNIIMQLHKQMKESRGWLKSILQSIKKLNPALVTVVEQDANHNGPFFLGRFLESLHYYSAMFDSLEACLPRNSPERMKIERFHLGGEIWNVVACEGSDRVERHERADQWRRQMGRAGFQTVEMKCLDQVRDLVGGYGCDGYSVGSEKGCLKLDWKGRPIMFASAWIGN